METGQGFIGNNNGRQTIKPTKERRPTAYADHFNTSMGPGHFALGRLYGGWVVS
jgi:hypothetical protein